MNEITCVEQRLKAVARGIEGRRLGGSIVEIIVPVPPLNCAPVEFLRNRPLFRLPVVVVGLVRLSLGLCYRYVLTARNLFLSNIDYGY